MIPIQLQPRSEDLCRWSALAHEQNCRFEVLELALAPAVSDSEAADALMRAYRRTDCVQSLHGAFIDVNPGSSDPFFRQLSQQRCRESCQAAVSLGASYVVFHGGAFPFLRGAYLDNWAAECAAFYDELAQTYPLKICIENAQDVDPAPLRILMDRISSPQVGVCLDVGHANYSRCPVSEWFDALADRISYLHLSDNLHHFDDHLPLGQGKVDWERVNCCWRQLDRQIPITLETGSLEATAASLQFLRKHQFFGLR